MRLRTKSFLLSVLLTSFIGCKNLSDKKEVPVSGPLTNNYLEEFSKKGRNRSPLDKRQMRYLTLKNGLKVLLVSSKDFTKSSAAVDVEVGSLANPTEAQGIAHFLEHMLFLGTKKYPKVGEYSEYLAANQGMSNAYTADEHTNYYFEVNNEAFTEALDRFSQFFVAPLFDEGYVKREMNAVHSEHQKNIRSDPWRGMRVLEMHMQKDHPQRTFGTGSLETLGHVTRKELLDFYHKHYSANRMSLVLLSPLPIDEQEKLVTEKFSEVENRELAKNIYPSEVFDSKDLPRFIYIKPIKDLRTIELVFQAPQSDSYWRSKPFDLLSFLVGHEGKGSLLSHLKKKKLVTTLSSGVEKSSFVSLFHVKFTLTENGLGKVNEVINDFFAYIRMLKSKELPRYIFDEVKKTGEIEFVFKEHHEGGRFASYYASKLHDHPSAHFESELELLWDYNNEDYQKFLSYVNPENLNAILTAQNVKTNQTEKYYGAEYSSERISTDRLKSWQAGAIPSDLKLPEPNQYIPNNLSLVEAKSSKPKQIISGAKGEFWFQTDTDFKLPKGRISLLLEMKKAKDIYDHHIKLSLYQKALDEGLNEWKYQLNLAGIGFSVAAHPRGVALIFEGYSQHIPKLMKQVADQLTDITISEEIFEIIKIELKRKLQNLKHEQAFRRVLYEVNDLSDPDFIHYKKFYDPEEGTDLISKVTLQEVKDFAKNLYQSFSVEGLAYGNFSEEPVVDAIDYYFTHLSTSVLAKEDRQKDRFYKFMPGESFAHIMSSNKEDTNSVWLSYVQFGQRDPKLDATMRVAESILQPDFYNDLRTTNQLGYIVHGGLRESVHALGFFFIVQSSTHTPVSIEDYYDKWLAGLKQKFEKTTSFEFDSLKNAVSVELLQPDKTIAERHSRLVFEALDLNGAFGYRGKVAAAAKALTKEQIIAGLDALLDKSKRAAVSVYLEKGSPSKALMERAKKQHSLIEDKDAYRKSRPTYL